MESKWQIWFIVLFILTGICLYLLINGLQSHHHDKSYTTHEDVGKHMRFLRNDIRFYIDREEELKEILKRLDIIELEESR